MSYNPNSADAMFSRVLTRMDSQDEALGRIEERQISFEAEMTKRVASLEKSRTEFRAKTGVIALVVSTSVGLLGWWVDRKIK